MCLDVYSSSGVESLALTGKLSKYSHHKTMVESLDGVCCAHDSNSGEGLAGKLIFFDYVIVF